MKNKGADQLRSYCEADLRLCFRIGKIRFSHDAAHIKFLFREDNSNMALNTSYPVEKNGPNLCL